MNKQLQDLLITIVAGMGMLLSTRYRNYQYSITLLKEQFQTSTDIAAFTITGYTFSFSYLLSYL